MKFLHSYWFRSGSYSLLGYGSQLGFAFFAFLVVVRLLPEYEFGVWVLYMTVTSFAEMARIGLIQNGLVKFCAEAPENYGRIISAGLLLNTLAGLSLALLLIGLGYPLGRLWSTPELARLLWWYLPYVLIFGSARFIDFVHMARGDFRGIFFSKFAYGFLFLAMVLGYWYWYGSLDLFWLPLLQIVAAAVSLIIILNYRRRYIRLDTLDLEWVARLFHFGKYVLGTNFSSMLFNKMDLMMVGAFINPVAVATYNVAARISNYMEAPMTGIAQVIYPKMAEANREKGEALVTALYEKSIAVLMSLMLPFTIGVLLLAKPVVVLLAGASYAGAAPVLSILVIAIFLKPWGRLFGITLDAIGRPRLNFQVLALSLLLNIGLNLLLIPPYGIRGAACATLIAIWTNIIAGQIIIRRILPVDHWKIVREMFALYQRSVITVRTKIL